MPNKAELVENINAMSTEVDAALGKLQADELVTLDGIETRVRDAMDAVANLPPDDAVEMRPVLVALLEKMEAFATVLQEKIDGLAAEGANAPQATAPDGADDPEAKE